LLCLPKLKHYGLFLGLCILFVLTTAYIPTEFSTGNPITEFSKGTTDAAAHSSMMSQLIIPTTGVIDTVIITDCGEQISFESDQHIGIQYVDTAARNDVLVICPSDATSFLRTAFTRFDLEEGDTLTAYDGRDLSSPLIDSGSGVGIFQMNGGWVSSNCDKSINPSGCLTFQFKTDGDDAKGAGWEAWITCEDGDISIMPPTNQFIALSCEEYTADVVVTAGKIVSECAVDDSLVVQVSNYLGTVCEQRCIRADSSFMISGLAIGQYTVTHSLKSFPSISTKNFIIVSPPALTCNDEVEAVIGTSCVASIRPDHILEGACDTSAILSYDLIVMTESGDTITTGTSRNGQFPIVTRDDVSVCGPTKYKVEVTRVYDYNGTNCSGDLVKDVCWGYINFVDSAAPEFRSQSVDTITACGTLNFDAILSSLTRPEVSDNCDAVTLEAIDFELISGDDCSPMRIYTVTWEAVDQCNNSATQKDTLKVMRPVLDNVIQLPDVILSCGEDSPEVMEDFDRLGIVRIPMPGDTIALSTEFYVCNFILTKNDEVVPHPGGKKVTRYWAVVDGCNTIPFPIMVDTQLIEFIDTLAPSIDCSPFGSLATAQSIPLPAEACAMAVTLPKPTATDVCAEPNVEMFVVEQLINGDWVKIANTLGEAGELSRDSFRVGWQAIDVTLDSLVLRDTCLQYFNLVDITPPQVICGDEVQITYNASGTRLFASEINHQSRDICGIAKVEIRLAGGEWAEFLDFVCTDVHRDFDAQLRFTDNGGNQNICGFNISVLDVIPPFCNDLADFNGTCDNFHDDQFGPTTDTNEDGFFNEAEWVDLTGDLLQVYNNQFGDPQCEDNIACVPFSSQQQYQLIYEQCGVVRGRRRFRVVDWNGQGLVSEWKMQEINITYNPGWSFTLPVDFFGECGASVPDANIIVENGACDLIGWEHEDQVFDIVQDACFKVIRTYHIINWCNYVQGQAPIELGRDENPFGLVTELQTITAADVANAGYYTYVQVLKVTDNTAPTLSINEVQTCIYGVGDVEPIGVEDQTPGAAPFECDTVRIFSVEASDCEQSAFSNFSFTYSIAEDGILVETGEASKFFWTVRPKVKYTVRFTVFDNCGNENSLTRDYEFWDCSKPTVICIPQINAEIGTNGSVSINAIDFNKGSFDNCTPTDELIHRIWHKSVSPIPPTDEQSVANLPSTITLGCDNLDAQQIFHYVIDLEGNFERCEAFVNVGNASGICEDSTATGQAVVAGNIQTDKGEMVEDVAIEIMGTGTMPSTATSTDGLFTLALNKGQAYEVVPTKETAPLNGVTTFDLIVISKHILGLQKFTTPYQYIAADVNQSGTVTAFDMVQLRQLILNIIPAFPNNNSWRFVDAKYAFTTEAPLTEDFKEKITINNHQADKMDANFVAIKIGDLNGSVTANTLQSNEARTTRSKMTFDLEDKILQADELFTIDFTKADLQELEGYQLALEFTGLELINIQEGLVKSHHFGQTLLARNILLSSWDRLSGSMDPTSDQTHLFSLQFKAHTAGKLSEFLHLQPKILTTQAYTHQGEIIDISLQFTERASGFELTQNRPNPFKETTSIGFQLPKAGKATLTILDIQGRVLLQSTKDFSQGSHEWIIEGQSLTTKGILYYQLATEEEVLTKKMMLIE